MTNRQQGDNGTAMPENIINKRTTIHRPGSYGQPVNVTLALVRLERSSMESQSRSDKIVGS